MQGAIMSRFLFILVFFCCSAGSLAEEIRWTFDEGEGTTARAKGAEATLSNVKWAKGRSGTALDFVSTNSVAIVKSHPLKIKKQITIEARVYPRAVEDGEGHRVVSCNWIKDCGWILWVDGKWFPKRIVFNTKNQLGHISQVELKDISPNRWYHVKATCDGLHAQLFVDGKLIGSALSTGLIGSDKEIEIGRGFKGLIDDLRISDTAETVPEPTRTAAAINDPPALWPQGVSGTALRIPKIEGCRAELGWENDLHFAGSMSIDVCVRLDRPRAEVKEGNWFIQRNGEYGVGFLADGRLRFADFRGACVDSKRSDWQAGKWYRITCIYDAEKKLGRIFVDGRPESEKALSFQSKGMGFSLMLPPFCGAMDELRIYDCAVGVNADGKVSSSRGPVAYYKFDEGKGTKIADSSPARIDGDVVNYGEFPYELAWANRKEERKPLADFEDLSGWKVIMHGDADARLERSQEQKLWGDYVGKVTYGGKNKSDYIEIVPPKPIPIPGPFDCVNIWVYGDIWGFEKAHKKVTYTESWLAVRIEDANGETHEMVTGAIDSKYWFIHHGEFRAKNENLPATYVSWGGDENGIVAFPAKFVGLVMRPCCDEEKRSVYFDSLSFYKAERKPLDIPEMGPVPIPNREETILPTCKAKYENRAFKEGDKYIFEYKGEDGQLKYVVLPKTGTLSDITVQYGEARFKPAEGGGFCLANPSGPIRPSALEKITLVKAGLEGSELFPDWGVEHGGVKAQFSMRMYIRGKSLIVEASSRDPVFAQFDSGALEGLKEPKVIQVPYLIASGSAKAGPAVVCGEGVFVTSLLDWYNSNATAMTAVAEKLGMNGATYGMNATYMPNSDGKRNSVRERLFITVSPSFDEALPNIPHPPSKFKDVTARNLYSFIGAPAPERLRAWKASGLDNIIVCHHETAWRIIGESFTLRTRTRPDVGDEGMRAYSDFAQSLGYRFGLYTNYTDFACVNGNWNEDWVGLNARGVWQRAWPRCYALKPALAWFIEARDAPIIHKKYNTSATHCDVHTAVYPWSKVDYDARVPQGAMFQPVYRSYAKLLLNEKEQHGPTFSEGTLRMNWVGLTDGDYGTIVDYRHGYLQGNPYLLPLLPDFDLLKLHPLTNAAGMHKEGMFAFFGRFNDELKKTQGDYHNRFFNQLLAATIAYGHIGNLSGDLATWGWGAFVKTYYMLQQLQQIYGTDTVAEIRYHDGKTFRTPSEAIANDAYLLGRLYVKYSRGLEVFVNYNEKDVWQIEGYTLPPFGFLARKDGELLEFDALIGGKRAAYVQSPEYIYADSWGEPVTLPGLLVRGSVAIKKDRQGCWWVIRGDDKGFSEMALDISLLRLGRPVKKVSAEAYKFEAGAPTVPIRGRWKLNLSKPVGERVAQTQLELHDGWAGVKPFQDCLRYLLVFE
jgi:hypothetical protein